MAKTLICVWTDDEIDRLKKLATQGATLMRPAAGLRRGNSSVQKKARELGLQIPGLRLFETVSVNQKLLSLARVQGLISSLVVILGPDQRAHRIQRVA